MPSAVAQHGIVVPSVHLGQLPGRQLEMKDARGLHLLFQVHDDAALTLLPPALRLTVPAVVSISLWSCADSEHGAFSVAQVRLAARLGARSRGLLLASFCDSASAGEALREHWGFGCAPAVIDISKYHERILGKVRGPSGEDILAVALEDPGPISPGDIELAASMHFVELDDGRGASPLRLMQVDTEHLMAHAERGRPTIQVWELPAASLAALRPRRAISAVYFTGELRLPAVRFAVVPGITTEAGGGSIVIE
jgi:hypothetical protein